MAVYTRYSEKPTVFGLGWCRRAMDPNDPTLELHDVAGVALVFAFIGLAVHSALHDPAWHFDPQTFGVGAAALISGIGGAGWLKGRLRNPPPPSSGEQQ